MLEFTFPVDVTPFAGTIMPIGKLDHYSIRTLDVEASRKFYTEVMGFTVGYRPPFNFPGLWLYNGGQYPDTTGIVHIVGVDLNNPEGLKEYLGDRDLSTLNGTDRKSTRLNSSHVSESRMPSSA